MTARTLLAFLVLGAPCQAVQISPEAKQDFNRYVDTVEARLAKQRASSETYIAGLGSDPEQRRALERDLRSGAVRVEPVDGGSWPVRGGLIHHWRATAFAAGATRSGMLALLKDYNHLSTYYQPEVVSSRAINESGGNATLVMRLKKQMGVTVVFDAEYRVSAGIVGANGGYGVSRSLHIWQLDAPGTPREQRRPEGDDDGLLWRMNAYWSFLETHDGLLIECEAVSLTRDVPAGLAWLITPIIKELPKTSIESTLTSTIRALGANARLEEQR